MRQVISENKSSGGFDGAASEPSTPAVSQTGSVGSESGKPHLFAPLRPAPLASSEEKRPFLRSEQRGHKYTGLPPSLSNSSQWLTLQHLAEKHVKSKGYNLLAKILSKAPR